MPKFITIAPDYSSYRSGIAVADGATVTDKNLGINCGNYKTANVQIVPGASANPSTEILFWSEGAGKFVSHNSASLTFTGKGNGVGYEVSVECNGRILFVKLTGTLTTGVDVYVSGYGLNHTE